MQRGSTLFLKAIILLMAIGALGALFWFPLTEGRARDLDVLSIYADPLIIYGYLAALPFFYGLFQTFLLLNLIEANQAFTKNAVNRLRNIKIAFFSLIGFILLALIYIRIFVRGDDPAGPTMLGIVMLVACSVIGAAAGVLQKNLQNAVIVKTRKKKSVR